MNIFSASKKRRQGAHNFIMNQSEGQISCLLALEPRIMYDAAGLATGMEGMEDAAQTPDHIANNPSTDTFQNEVSDIQEAFNGYIPPTQNSSTEIVFISMAVPDYQHLVQGISSDARVVLVDPNADGVSQISKALASYRDLDAIHIVSHGGQGSLFLGQSQLTTGNLAENAKHLKTWGEALSKEGDILLYGCDVAAGKEGQAFVQQLSEITGADVAASTDTTGAETLGGDWDLEEKSGDIETGLAFSEKSLETYDNVLPNTAPVLNISPEPQVETVTRGEANDGELVKNILAPIATDADGDPLGMAVTFVDNANGTWQYTTNGGADWIDFTDGLSDSNATLLAGDSLTGIRFLAHKDFLGKAFFKYRAWDQTDGYSNGFTGKDVSTNGGTSAYSAAYEVAEIKIVDIPFVPLSTANPPPPLPGEGPTLEPLFKEQTDGPIIKPDNYLSGADEGPKLYAPPPEPPPENLTQEEGVEPKQETMEEGEELPPEEEQLVEEVAADEEVMEEQPLAVVAPVEDGATVEALPLAEAKIEAPENNLTDQLAKEADKATAERAEIMKIFKDVYELLQCK